MEKINIEATLLKLLGHILVVCCSLVLLSVIQDAKATHAASTNGEMENRPAPVFRRICLGGTNAGNYCKEDSECPGSGCAERNVFNITIAIRFNASTTQLNAIQNLVTSMSGVLFDVTDGQAEIGTATIHNDAISTSQADLVIHPTTNDTWWQANSGHYRTGGFMEVSINYINDPANQGVILAHEFAHLVFDARDEYESRLLNCGALNGNADCPVTESGDPTGLMDGNGTELCWGQGNPADLSDISMGNHDHTSATEQSSCRSNRSVWDQLTWAWPSTFLQPVGAPDPAANGAVVNPPNFVISQDNIRVVLVLDESNSMTLESPTRMQRLQVAASDFIATAENGSEVGIVSYSNDADTSSGHAGLTIAPLVTDRSNWNNAIANLTPGGWTNIGDGLQKAKDMIVDAGGVTANTYIVLMTDGLNNRPEPQVIADADLQAKIDDLLLSGIPVYVTCTGGDLGLQSQCAEIGSGTNGFSSDSADAAKLPEVFVDFHEVITGHQGIDSVYSSFDKIDVINSKSFFVDSGSRSVSFSFLWQDANAGASVTVEDPDGNIYQTRSIPQGKYTRIDNPVSGDWKMRIDPRGKSKSKFVAKAYTHNRINNFVAYLRNNNIKPNEEIIIYAVPHSFGGAITKVGQVLTAIVTLPDGSKQFVELKDNGRDAGGHGDDMPDDGVFTGTFSDTLQKGAYGFQIKADIEGWQLGEDGHNRDEGLRSPRFVREVRVSASVSDPNDVETTPEDEPKAQPDGPEIDEPEKLIIWILYLIVILIIFLILLVWRCCHRKSIVSQANVSHRQR